MLSYNFLHFMANVIFVGGEVGGSRRGEIVLGQTFADLNGVGEVKEKNGQQDSFRKEVKDVEEVKEGGRL